MPIARVMNNPDGSTPTPQTGGGDSNGTLARSILGGHAGTAANPLGQPAHLHYQCSQAGIPAVALAAADIGQGQPVAVELTAPMPTGGLTWTCKTRP